MISLIDYLRCANLMRQQYGEAAALECVVKATACLERGDHQGHHVWLEIIRALDVLEAKPGSVQ